MKRIITCVIIIVMSVFFGLAAAEEFEVISLSDEGIVCDSPGLRVNGNVLTVALPGEYTISGALSQGQIVVDCEREGKVTLELKNASIHNETGPAIYIRTCKPRLSISLADQSINKLSGGEDFIFEDDDEPNGVIFSKDDLTITGSGQLDVLSNCMDGIVSKDDLRIKGGIISVTAPRNGIRGKDSVEIYDGVISINAGLDGIKSTNKNDAKWGYVDITGGEISIICEDEPISAITGIRVTQATINATIVG